MTDLQLQIIIFHLRRHSLNFPASNTSFKMARQRSKKLSEGRKTKQEDVPRVEHDSEEEISEDESLDAMDKDTDEEDLERGVLGDEGAFRAQLTKGYVPGKDAESDEDEIADAQAVEEGLEGVEDADVRNKSSWYVRMC